MRILNLSHAFNLEEILRSFGGFHNRIQLCFEKRHGFGAFLIYENSIYSPLVQHLITAALTDLTEIWSRRLSEEVQLDGTVTSTAYEVVMDHNTDVLPPEIRRECGLT
ncbi:hypothetical protein J6590_005138 [Homalodisca vitripennis]|nr:hypothetical protein J6590_005138 [Homalodisca vitripennis]